VAEAERLCKEGKQYGKSDDSVDPVLMGRLRNLCATSKSAHKDWTLDQHISELSKTYGWITRQNKENAKRACQRGMDEGKTISKRKDGSKNWDEGREKWVKDRCKNTTTPIAEILAKNTWSSRWNLRAASLACDEARSDATVGGRRLTVREMETIKRQCSRSADVTAAVIAQEPGKKNWRFADIERACALGKDQKAREAQGAKFTDQNKWVAKTGTDNGKPYLDKDKWNTVFNACQYKSLADVKKDKTWLAGFSGTDVADACSKGRLYMEMKRPYQSDFIQCSHGACTDAYLVRGGYPCTNKKGTKCCKNANGTNCANCKDMGTCGDGKPGGKPPPDQSKCKNKAFPAINRLDDVNFKGRCCQGAKSKLCEPLPAAENQDKPPGAAVADPEKECTNAGNVWTASKKCCPKDKPIHNYGKCMNETELQATKAKVVADNDARATAELDAQRQKCTGNKYFGWKDPYDFRKGKGCVDCGDRQVNSARTACGACKQGTRYKYNRSTNKCELDCQTPKKWQGDQCVCQDPNKQDTGDTWCGACKNGMVFERPGDITSNCKNPDPAPAPPVVNEPAPVVAEPTPAKPQCDRGSIIDTSTGNCRVKPIGASDEQAQNTWDEVRIDAGLF
jgi:hypothetical protein